MEIFIHFISTSFFIFIFSSDGDDSPSDGNDSDTQEDNYYQLLHDFSKKWLSLQLTHNVSLKATDAFWRVAVNSLNRIYSAKSRQGVKKRIPQFAHQRRTLYSDECPRIGMNFAYLHKDTEEIHEVRDVDTAPIRRFENYSTLDGGVIR